jgi:hypothetical protein
MQNSPAFQRWVTQEKPGSPGGPVQNSLARCFPSTYLTIQDSRYAQPKAPPEPALSEGAQATKSNGLADVGIHRTRVHRVLIPTLYPVPCSLPPHSAFH